MTTVEQIQYAIKSLPPKEYTRLRRWFTEREWELWDRQIEMDSEAGKLDFLVEEGNGERLPLHIDLQKRQTTKCRGNPFGP